MPLPYEIVDANLHTALRVFGEATGVGAVERLPGIVVIDSGLDYAVFNLGVLNAPRVESVAELRSRVDAANAHYQARGARWSLWMCEEHADIAVRNEVRRELVQSGFRQIASPPGMMTESLAAPAHPLPAIDCRPVADGATRLAFTHISAISFDIPFQTAQRVYGEDAAWQGAYHGWIGMVNETPVCCAATVVESESIGVYSVGTLPGYRRRGYAEALMRKALDIERAETGLARSLLQASDVGEALYRQMGYRQVSRYAVYLLG